MFKSFLIAILFSTIALSICQAKYAGDGPYKQWFSEQKNDHGMVCCDEADGKPYLGDYKIQADGSVILEDGRKIPSWMVLKSNNPTGKPILWVYLGDIRCFSPGTLT